MFAFGPAVTRIEVCELTAFHDNISSFILIIIIIAIDYIIMVFFVSIGVFSTFNIHIPSERIHTMGTSYEFSIHKKHFCRLVLHINSICIFTIITLLFGLYNTITLHNKTA